MYKLDELYYEVNKYIKMLDFNELWNGFKPFKFALYNDNECFFDGHYIEKTNDFIANTSINYKNEIIAIWNVMEEVNPIILTSKIIHEMYHGYQMLNNESRFPNELDALYNYKYNDNNLSIKLIENKLIAELVSKFDIDKYRYLLSLRKYRFNNYNYEYVYESKIEQIEGSACYVELNVLKQLSNELYLNKLNSMKKRVVNPNNLLPIRIISYDIGALLLTILKENNIVFNQRLNDISYSIDLITNIDEIAPNDMRATYQTVTYAVYFGLSGIAGNSIGGWMIENHGFRKLYLSGAVVIAVSILGLYLVNKSRKRKEV
jgi:hypothetical protein